MGYPSLGFLIQGEAVSSTSTSASSSLPAGPTSARASSVAKSAGLSTGEKAAIGIVIPIAVLAFPGGGAYLIFRRKMERV
jgi:hypothetical protein